MAKKKYKPKINRAKETDNITKNLFNNGGPTEDLYWWATPEKSSFIGSNNGMKLAEGLGQYTLNTNIRNAATSVDIASNPLIDNYSRIASNPIQISEDITGIPDKIDVTVGGKSLAEGPLTNQELGIKPKTDWSSVASAAMPVVDSIVNPKRNTTTAGNIMQGIGGAVSMINPVAGLAIQGAGMLTNAAFGSNIDESKVKAYETQADAVANTTFGGSTNEQLLSQYQAVTPLETLSKDDIGSEGWFSNKATNKVNELNKEREAANNIRLANFDLAVNNLEQQNLMYDMANFAKYGGKINIKPSKRGTFTRAAKSRGLGVQEFASKVLSNPDNYSEAMRKKAQFARNFGSRKHSMGGYLVGQTYDISEQEYNRLIQLGYEIEVL